MQVTIETSEDQKYIFNTDELPDGPFERSILRHCNAMIDEFEVIMCCNKDDIVTTIELQGMP